LVRTTTLSAILAIALIPAACSPEESPDQDTAESVVLLHGLGRSSRSMAPVGRFLRQHGYRVVNVDYPSREETIETLADGLEPSLAPLCARGGPAVHVVTHSLGGILLRQYLAAHRCASLGRVVMLSPPNRGSEMADRFGNLAGPAGGQLGTGEGALPSRLGPVDFELGVIVGNRSLNPVGSAVLPGDDDGMVSVESARVEGMQDFLVMPATHTFIMNKRDVLEQVLAFLQTGRFRRDAGE
jgi:pimeloyl-ACP methyl ester carboxylesterase